MLRRVHIARLAFQHSPETEQRLTLYKATKRNQNFGNSPEDDRDKALDAAGKPRDEFMKEMLGEARGRLSFLNELADIDVDSTERVTDFYRENRSTLENADFLGRTLDEHEDVRGAIRDMLALPGVREQMTAARELMESLRNIDFQDSSEAQKDAIEAYFDANNDKFRIVLGAKFRDYEEMFLRFEKDSGNGDGKELTRDGKLYVTEYIVAESLRPAMEKERQEAEEKREKGPEFSFCSEAEMKQTLASAKDTMSPKQFDDLMAKPPSSFIWKGFIYFNVDHPRNRNSEERRNTIAHELTHFEIDRASRGPAFLKKFEMHFRAKGVWENLKQAVDASYANSGGFDSASDEDYMHEILAIYTADTVQADDKENLKQICTIVAGVFEPPLTRDAQELADSLSELNGAVRTSFAANAETAENNLSESIAESDERKLAQETLERTDNKARRNPDEEKKAKKEIADDNEKKGEEANSPGKVEAKISETLQRIGKFKQQLGSIKEKVAKLPEKERKESEAGLAMVEKLVEKDLPDLIMFQGWMDTLSRWDTPENDGGPSEEKRRFLAKNCGLGDTATISESQRKEILKAVMEAVATIDGPLSDVEDFDKNADDTPKKKDDKEIQQSKGYLRWIKENIFTSGNGIEWMSIYDIVRVFKVHQEAWVAKYKENQERRVYRVAKHTNIRKDLQPTLDKQSRSANEKQTSDFADYLKTSGLDYMQLMDKEKGLYYRLDNINEKKAVLEFAAEKAWLYDIDPLDGHNVYGVDFIAEFGPEAFLHLVQSYEGGKSKEEKRGHEKVNKRPDIPPMIKDLIHELHDKNLFAAKGIFKRIQEKAKLTHSHLWAMTTFLSEMRKDPALLRTLDKGLLDDFGNIGIGESAWGLTMFKMLRDDLMRLKEGAEFGTTCILDKTIVKIEKRITDALGPNPVFRTNQGKIKTMEEAVAWVMASKTLKEPGLTLTIFDNDFSDYRAWWLERANTTTSAAKTDDDFFGTEGSDIMLTGEAIIKEVGTRDSTGRPTHQRKAPNFYASVIDRYDELRKDNPASLLNYRSEMKGKFRQWLRTYISSNAASAGQMPEEMDGKNRYLLDAMLERGIFDPNDIISTLRSNIFGKDKDGKPNNEPLFNRINAAIEKGKREIEATKNFSTLAPSDTSASSRSSRVNVKQQAI